MNESCSPVVPSKRQYAMVSQTELSSLCHTGTLARLKPYGKPYERPENPTKWLSKPKRQLISGEQHCHLHLERRRIKIINLHAMTATTTRKGTRARTKPRRKMKQSRTPSQPNDNQNDSKPMKKPIKVFLRN